MMFKKTDRPAKARLGCGFLCVSALLTCILLAINGLIVMNLVNAFMPMMGNDPRNQRAAQAIVFLGPLVLLMIEWWVCDVAIDWLRPAGMEGKGPEARR
jgi:hypothetical protein